MTTISTDAPPEGSVRHRQILGACALADLLGYDLPRAVWVVQDLGSTPQIEGQVHRDNDDDVRAGLAAWADALAAEVRTTPYPGYVGHRIETVHEGVEVRMWGHTDVTGDRAATPSPEPVRDAS